VLRLLRVTVSVQRCGALCENQVMATDCTCADRLTLRLIYRVGHRDPCVLCGANFVATAFEGKAHSLRAVLTRKKQELREEQ
jgi:hypothetical protein